MDPLDDNGLSEAARHSLSTELQERIAEAWRRDRALILNANKPGYSEAFTIAAEQYTLLRRAILRAVDEHAGDSGEVQQKVVVAHVQATLGSHRASPKGRMTNCTRYTKTDLEARSELVGVPKKSPQRIRRP